MLITIGILWIDNVRIDIDDWGAHQCTLKITNKLIKKKSEFYNNIWANNLGIKFIL